MRYSTDFLDQPLLSAEVHYFRVPRDDWELLLVRMRQMGANTISTYVPWAWHAPEPDVLDLAGDSHPQRDVAGFVRLCGQLGLRVILKPGPFVDAELLGGGIPPWLLRERPEMHALRPDGLAWCHSDSGAPRACYLHPAYLEPARRWIAAFSAAMLPAQAPAGPVVALQADNETPGDGMLPADVGLDPRFKLDYNPYVVGELWAQWRASRKLSNDANLRPTTCDLRSWVAPQSLDELRQYAQLDAFTDWYYTTAVATVVAWLRADGWSLPIYHNLLAVPWEAGGTTADMPGLAGAAGWLGHNVYVEDARDSFVGRAEYQLSFEEYVHYAHWRTRLVKQLSPGWPSFVSEISAAQDFYFAAPFVGGLQAINVYMGAQSRPDNPGIGAFPRWAMEAPVRSDGSVRPRFWNAKTPFTLLGAAGADFAAARAPADLALGYSHVPERVGAWTGTGVAATLVQDLQDVAAGCDYALRSQILAQRLVRAGVDFDVLDLDAATPEDLARYALVVAPAAAVLAGATQATLAACANLALVGDARVRYDENLKPCDLLGDGGWGIGVGNLEEQSNPQPPSPIPPPLRLSEDVTGERLADLVVDRGGAARYAWADSDDIDVSVRYGAEYTYLLIANRRPTAYSGTLTYRERDGSIQHLHAGLDGPRVGIVLIKDDEVIGAAIGGDGAEGGWLARGMHTSIVFNSGAGVVAPCGAGLLFSAPQSGRFQVRRPAGWPNITARRLLLSGALLPAAFQTDNAHLVVPYTAEDERGQTDAYLLLPEGQPLARTLRDQLVTLLQARAAALRRASELAVQAIPSADEAAALTEAAAIFTQVAGDLERLAECDYTLDEYGTAWDAAGEQIALAAERLARALAHARGEHLAGALDSGVYGMIEERITSVLGIVARGGLALDRE
jgi:beta-galactosidase